MKIIVFLTLISIICVVVANDDIIEENNNESASSSSPKKYFKLPSYSKNNNLDITPIHSHPYVERRHARTRIAGGKEVKEEQQHLFVHQVRIVAESNNVSGELSGCGASILSNEWVVTAAHCLDVSKKIDMYFGMLDERDKEFKEHRNATPDNWYIHPQWSRKIFKNDIALVKLIPKLNFTDEIHSIALPRRKNCTAYLGTHVTVSGWGLTSDSVNDNSNLQYVDVNIVHKPEDCKQTWGNFIDFETMLCVDAARKKGACAGDSGGPMVYTQRNGLQVLIGLTSFGSKKGCEVEDPRVYTCINGFRDWIFQITKDPKLED